MRPLTHHGNGQEEQGAVGGGAEENEHLPIPAPGSDEHQESEKSRESVRLAEPRNVKREVEGDDEEPRDLEMTLRRRPARIGLSLALAAALYWWRPWVTGGPVVEHFPAGALDEYVPANTAAVLALNTAMPRNEIRLLRWGQIDWERRTVTVGRSKTEAGEGRLIPLNAAALETLVRWASRFPNTEFDHHVFPWCENRHLDHTRPTKGWRTAWRHALMRAGFHCRFHDLRVTCITKLAESHASDMTIMAIAGHEPPHVGTLQSNPYRGQARSAGRDCGASF